MMMSDKIFGWLATAVICSLLLAAGCAQTASLALKFTPQGSTTYKVITEHRKSVSWEGPIPAGTDFKGGQTSTRVEMTFTQNIQSTDDKGNAVAEITIKGLKYLSIIRDNPILDFDSSREKDKNNPMAGLIGRSYTIEIAPTGKVTKVIDVKQAQAAVKGSSSANKKTALTLLKPDVIKGRHGTLTLPDVEKNQLRTGGNWGNIKTFSFGLMGTKSYERIYTLKKIEGRFKKRAIVEMNAIPTSEMAEQGSGETPEGLDTIETYTGRLKLDLTTGKIEKYHEKLESEWVMVVPPTPETKGPVALKMGAIRFYRLEKID